MSLTVEPGRTEPWRVRKIVVVGPGIVGMPMAAMLAQARIRVGVEEPAEVVVLQRPSATSGWKVAAINAGRSPIGGVEPELDRIVAEAVAARLLRASHDYGEARDADVVLVCVQTDKRGLAPDYGPLFEALDGIRGALRTRPAGRPPLLIIESTLAPSSMATVIRERFAAGGLVEGRDILLGNSPNRVMPGRLVERIRASDKLVGGLRPETPRLIARLYGQVVTRGRLHCTNSLTAEIVKTLENAYRDVRIAYAAEVARYCDDRDVDFHQVRRAVNRRLAQADAASDDPNAVPSGGLLVPTVGVGGHCLPKDGILLWWRALETGLDTGASLILEARRINDDSPAVTLRLAERELGPLAGRRVALLGTAYRFNSEDTRNSPTLALARLLLERGAEVTLHDPYVRPDDQNLRDHDLVGRFTNDLDAALDGAEFAICCTAHRDYLEPEALFGTRRDLRGVLDGANLYRRDAIERAGRRYAGIGRGRQSPPSALVDAVYAGFRAVERGVANEVGRLAEFFNRCYAVEPFDRVELAEVRRFAATCVTGCDIVEPGPVGMPPAYDGFVSRLVARAVSAARAG